MPHSYSAILYVSMDNYTVLQIAEMEGRWQLPFKKQNLNFYRDLEQGQIASIWERYRNDFINLQMQIKIN